MIAHRKLNKKNQSEDFFDVTQFTCDHIRVVERQFCWLAICLWNIEKYTEKKMVFGICDWLNTIVLIYLSTKNAQNEEAITKWNEKIMAIIIKWISKYTNMMGTTMSKHTFSMYCSDKVAKFCRQPHKFCYPKIVSCFYLITQPLSSPSVSCAFALPLT